MRLGLDLYSRRSGSAASFPWDLPSLIAWFNASEASTITQSSGDVSRWDSQGGSNYAEQTVSGERPVTGTRTINSVNALDLDSSNDEHFDLPNSIDMSSGVSGVVIFNLDSGGTNRPLIGSTGAGGFTLRTNSSRELQIVRTSEAVLLTGSTALSTGADYIVGFRATDTSLDLYINGGTADATATTNPAFTAASEYIGRSVTTNWDGAIGLVGVYSGHLSDADLNTVANAAASEYGLTWADI